MAIIWDERSKARDYVVKAGDTLTSIAAAECPDLGGFSALARFNWGTVRPRELVRALVETIGVATGDLSKIGLLASPELMPLLPDADLPAKLKIPVPLKKKDLPVEKTHKLKLKAIHAATAVSILDLDRWFIPQHEACTVEYGLEGDAVCADKVVLDVFGSNYCECTDWNKGNGTYGAPADFVDVPLFTKDLAAQAEERHDYGLPDDAPWKGEVTATTGMLGRKTDGAAQRHVNVAFSPYTMHVRYFKAGGDKDARIVLDPFWPKWKETPTAQTVTVDDTTKKAAWTNAADADRGALCIEDKNGQSVCLADLTGDLLKAGAREFTWDGAYRPGAMNSRFGAVMLADAKSDDKPYKATITTFKRELETTPMKVSWKVKKASKLTRGIVQIADGTGKLVYHKALKEALCAEGDHELTWDGKYGAGAKNSLGGDTIIPADMPYRVQIQLHRDGSAAEGLALGAMHTEVRLVVHPKSRAPADLLFDPWRDKPSLAFGVAPLVPGKLPVEGDGTKWYQHKLAEYGFHPGPVTGSTNDEYKLSMKEFKRSVPADGTATAGNFTRLVIDEAENDATKTAIKKIRDSDKRAWFGDREKVRANDDAVDLANAAAMELLRNPEAGIIAWVDGRQYYTQAAAKDDSNADFTTGNAANDSFGLKNYRGSFDIGDVSVTRDEESVARPWLPLRVHLPLLSQKKGLYDEPDALGTGDDAKKLLDAMRVAVGPVRVDWTFDELPPDFSEIDPADYDPQFTRSRRYVAWAIEKKKATRNHKDTGRPATFTNCKKDFGGQRPTTLDTYYKDVFGLDDLSLAPWRATDAATTESVATVVHDHLSAAQAKDTDLFPDAIGTAGAYFHPSRIAGDGYRLRAQVRFEETDAYKLPNLAVLKARYPVVPLANSARVRLWRKSSARGYLVWAGAGTGHWPGFMTNYRKRFRAAHVYFVHEGGTANTFAITDVFDPAQAPHRTRFEKTVKNNVDPSLHTATVTLKSDYIWPWSDDPRFGWNKPSLPDESIDDFLDRVTTGTWRAFRDGLLLSVLRTVEKKGFLRGHLFVEFKDSPALTVLIYSCSGGTPHETLVMVKPGSPNPALGACASCGSPVAPAGSQYNLGSMNLPAVGIGLGATWLFTSSDENTWVHEVGHHRHLEHAASVGSKPALHDSEANDLHLATPDPPNVVPRGTAGAKKYGYKIIATDGTNPVSGLSPAGTTGAGATTLNATNFNRVSWAAFAGATHYQVYRTESDGTPATTGLIGTVAGTTIDDKGLAAGAAAVAPPGSWSAVVNSANVLDRAWDRHCVMSYAGCGDPYPPSNKEYLCGKCLLRHKGWKVERIITHPGPKVREP
jgi:flagellar hook assembly protein FlgD